MPEVEYTTTLNISREESWDFVKDMNNWAPFLTGYQKHEVLNETDSIWTLKGDVGVLARRVELKAHVTEWSGPAKVAFTLTGINEPVDGGGELCMTECAAEAPATALATAKPASLLRRILDAIARFFFRRAHGAGPARLAAAAPGVGSRLTFTLRMEAKGTTAPLVNAMLGPAMLPAAEDLANKIAAHLEAARRPR